MCIVAFAWKAHPRWQLIALGNRDEMHARPTLPLARWSNTSHLIAGQDAEAGGTWLGVSEQGRFAVVTNLAGFGNPQSERASRGDLLKNFLSGNEPDPEIGIDQFSDFNPFNLITVSNDQASIHSNRPTPTSAVLDTGVHGLSNGSLENPWRKSTHLNTQLQNWLADGAGNPELLLDSLINEQGFGPDLTKDQDANSQREPSHSPIFIRSPVYGTRCSSLVAIDSEGTGQFIERRYLATGETDGETRIAFQWPS